MTPPAVDPSFYLDSARLASLKRQAAADDPKALRAAAQQFEALFTSMVLKSMQKANFKDPLFGSDQQSFYQDMYDQQLALEISKGPGLGLADMLVQQMRRNGAGDAGSGGSAASASGAGSGAGPVTDAAQAPLGNLRTATASPGNRGSGARAPARGSGSAAGELAVPSVTSAAARAAAASVYAKPGNGGLAAPPTVARVDMTAASAGSSCGATPDQQVAFARSLWPEAQRAAQQLGTSPVNLIAQAALETDWGRSLPRGAGGTSSNNLFGIKAGSGWSGAAVESGTREYRGGIESAARAQFRSYASTGQCFHDYVTLLQGNPRYAGALGTGSDAQAFASGLQQGGYATDPDYARKVGAVADTLTRTLKLASARPITPGSGAL